MVNRSVLLFLPSPMLRFSLSTALLALAAVAVAPALYAQTANASSRAAGSPEIQEHMTPNGMKILVAEDASIPNIAVYTFFRVGSRNEHEGITGISHFFEHMMFNGAQKYGHGEFDKTLELAGGSNNAYTSNDLTVYQDWTPASALETVFDLESDRIAHLAFDPAVIKSERQVVYSERRLRTDNSNPGLLSEQLEAAAFTAAPYHWPVVGWPTDIESWTMEDLKSYFAMGYSPNNATMVVVGAVHAEDVFRLADKYIGPIATHATPPPVRTKEPVQLGERRVEVNKFAQAPLLMIGWHAVDAKSPDYYAFQLLDNILTTGQSSRLYRSLVDGQQLATYINTGLGETLDPSLFRLSAQPRKDVAPEKLEDAINAQMDMLAQSGPTPEELQKAKNQAIAQHYRELRTIAGRAQAIGAEEVLFGDYHKLAGVEASLDAVTAADIQRVMTQYLIKTNRTVATLVPDASAVPPPAPRTPPPGAQPVNSNPAVPPQVPGQANQPSAPNTPPVQPAPIAPAAAKPNTPGVPQ
jgi:zinc protease